MNAQSLAEKSNWDKIRGTLRITQPKSARHVFTLFLGRVAEKCFLAAYMKKFLLMRNAYIKALAGKQ